MFSIIVLFPKLEDARNIRNLLVRNGIDVTAVCTTGAQVIHTIDDMDAGVVVCGYKYSDMLYAELRDCMPDTFDMLLIASKLHFDECLQGNIVCIPMPLKSHDLINTLNAMIEHGIRKQKKRKERPKERTDEEKAVIENAKIMLISQRGFTEQQAHKYLQKQSMDNGMNLVETARRVLELF